MTFLIWNNTFVNLDNIIWDPETICALLKACYPKGQHSSNNDTLYNDAIKILPRFDLNKSAIEQEYSYSFLTLLDQAGQDIDGDTQKMIVKHWITKWPKPFQELFKRFIINKDNDTIEQFIVHIFSYTASARQLKNATEKYGYIVQGSTTSAYFGPSHKDDHTRPSGSGSHENPK